MRKYRELTEKEIREIEVYKCRRKCLYITVPMIAMLSGYSVVHLHEVESHRYRMTESLKEVYERVINFIETEAKKYRKPEKRE